MTIQPLSNFPVETITNCFNKSFANYIVPLQLTTEQMKNKMINDCVDLDLSVGTSIKGELVGFILHGIGNFSGRYTAYNAGTGVIPEKRGFGLTGEMYRFILPSLKNKGIEQCSLEVIENNTVALKSYQKIGFKISRKFTCFRGDPLISNPQEFSTAFLTEPDWNYLESFWNWEPSWPNSREAVQRSWNKLNTIAIEENALPIGYLIYNPESGRISQIAVKKDIRGQGIGTGLFSELSKKLKKEISLINIDSSDVDTVQFLKRMGMKAYINQFEMIMHL